MKEKGFTIVELLGVMTILALLMILIIPNIMKSADSVKIKSFNTKVDLIETGAADYGYDNYRRILDGVAAHEEGYENETIDDITYKTYTLKVADLIPDYVTKDIEDGDKFVQDPRQAGRFLDDCTITIRINPKTRKVTAEFHDPYTKSGTK